MRLIIYSILDTFEPVIRPLSRILATVGAVLALLLEFIIKLPNFPFLLVFSLSICFGLVASLYSLALAAFRPTVSRL